jgi:hypothetical protein
MLHYVLPPSLTTPLADIQGGLIDPKTTFATQMITALTPTMTADIQGGLIDPKTRSSVQYAINLLLIDAVPLFGAIAKAARRIKVRERPRA